MKVFVRSMKRRNTRRIVHNQPLIPGITLKVSLVYVLQSYDTKKAIGDAVNDLAGLDYKYTQLAELALRAFGSAVEASIFEGKTVTGLVRAVLRNAPCVAIVRSTLDGDTSVCFQWNNRKERLLLRLSYDPFQG